MSKSKAEAKAERAAALRKDVDFVEHTWEADRLYEHFGCTLEKGLSAEQVLVNRAKYGENRLTPPELTPWYIKFLMQFANFFALLLLGGGALASLVTASILRRMQPISTSVSSSSQSS